MTELGIYLFVALIVTLIGLVIQYYLIKASTLAALKKHSESSGKHEAKLLELIALGVGPKEMTEQYLKLTRIKDYENKLREIKEKYSPEERKRQDFIEDLQREYADVLEEN